MRFATGFLDSIFGKKVTLGLIGPDGVEVEHRVTRKWLCEQQSAGKIRQMSTIKVNILDPLQRLDLVEDWTVGQDVEESIVTEFRDISTGELFVISICEDGQKQMVAVTGEVWQKAKENMNRLLNKTQEQANKDRIFAMELTSVSKSRPLVEEIIVGVADGKNIPFLAEALQVEGCDIKAVISEYQLVVPVVSPVDFALDPTCLGAVLGNLSCIEVRERRRQEAIPAIERSLAGERCCSDGILIMAKLDWWNRDDDWHSSEACEIWKRDRLSTIASLSNIVKQHPVWGRMMNSDSYFDWKGSVIRDLPSMRGDDQGC